MLIPALLTADYLQAHRLTQDTRWLVLTSMFLLFLSPLHMFLLFRWRLACILAIVLLAWFWGISREILHRSNHGGVNLQPDP